MLTNSSPIAPVLIVGAGLAGLACGVELTARKIPFRIIEAGDRPGGRVRTDRHRDGYLLDRGFQVILDAYPAFAGLVEIDALAPHRFARGAAIWDGTRTISVSNPLSNPGSIRDAFDANLGAFSDKTRLAKLALSCRLAKWASATDATMAPNASGTALEFLQAEGFSDRFIEGFAKPFWGGISLDRSLSGNAGQLLFTLKMFLEGNAILPASGVQALPDALVAKLPTDAITYGVRATSLIEENGRVSGVRTEAEPIAADTVIIATDPLAARDLTGIESIPSQGLGCTTVYLAGDREPGLGSCLLLNAAADHGVNHIAPLSSVAPSYAPTGRHLVSAVLLDHPRIADLSEPALTQMARAETARIFGHPIEAWTPVSTVRVPFSQFAQPPGYASKLPTNRTNRPGLLLAGDYTRDSSVNGAVFSGLTAAKLAAADVTHRLAHAGHQTEETS